MITNVQLTTKERFLLEDAKSHEEQCILKYDNYSNLAVDPQLKAVFRTNGIKEEEHLQSINQMLSGKVPTNVGQGGSSGTQNTGKSSGSQSQSNGNSGTVGTSSFKASDKDLCMDMLSAEKYVSGTYNTAIFEFKDAQMRDALNHIQTEEQKHGEAIFAYMQSKGMYTPS